jgi:hypothetical protein
MRGEEWYGQVEDVEARVRCGQVLVVLAHALDHELHRAQAFPRPKGEWARECFAREQTPERDAMWAGGERTLDRHAVGPRAKEKEPLLQIHRQFVYHTPERPAARHDTTRHDTR